MTKETTKSYEGFLLINWKDDDLRFRKTKPADHSPWEVPMAVEVEVNVPKFDTPTLAAEVNVPRTQVAHAAYGEIVESEDDLPPWSEAVESVLETADAVDRYVYDDASLDRVTDELLGRALREVEGYPDPDDVREYIRRRVLEFETEVGE